MHPDKTRIVYCKDDKRRGAHEHTSFAFLGFTFTRRAVLGRSGAMFNGFLPAVSAAALKEMGRRVRRWRIHRHNANDLAELAAWVNPIVAAWMTYFGRFYRSKLYPLLRRINSYLMRWARQKYERLHAFKACQMWWRGLFDREPTLLRHGAWMRDVDLRASRDGLHRPGPTHRPSRRGARFAPPGGDSPGVAGRRKIIDPCRWPIPRA